MTWVNEPVTARWCTAGPGVADKAVVVNHPAPALANLAETRDDLDAGRGYVLLDTLLRPVDGRRAGNGDVEPASPDGCIFLPLGPGPVGRLGV